MNKHQYQLLSLALCLSASLWTIACDNDGGGSDPLMVVRAGESAGESAGGATAGGESAGGETILNADGYLERISLNDILHGLIRQL